MVNFAPVLYFTCLASALAACNIFQNVPATLSLYAEATPYTYFEFTNDCPYAVSVFVGDAPFIVLSPKNSYVAAVSSSRMLIRCMGPETVSFTSTSNETASVVVDCMLSPVTAPSLIGQTVPLVGNLSESFTFFPVSSPVSLQELPRYFPYELARAFNAGFACAPCNPCVDEVEQQGLDWGKWPLNLRDPLCGLHDSLDLGHKHKCPTTTTTTACPCAEDDVVCPIFPCLFRDIRTNANYTEIPGIGILELDVPNVNTLLNSLIIQRQPVVVFNGQDGDNLRPVIPNPEIPTFISALWIDYEGVEEVGWIYVDGIVTIQWTALQIWSEATISVQIQLNVANGDFNVRSGQCVGDPYRLLDGAITGYQSTDPSGQVLYKQFRTVAPCSASLDCEMFLRAEYVEQDVSDWVFPEPIDLQNDEVPYTVTPVYSGTLAYGPFPVGEIQLLDVNGTIYQGTWIIPVEET